MIKNFYTSVLCAITGVMVYMQLISEESSGTFIPQSGFYVTETGQSDTIPKVELKTDTVIVVPNTQVDGVVRGSRPVVDFMAIPDSLLVPGHLIVKFYPHAEPFLKTVDTGNLQTGLRDFDSLNRSWGVVDIVSDYDTVFYKKEFAERHRKWGFHLWYQIHFPEGTDIKKAMLAYRELASMLEIVEPEIVVNSNHLNAGVTEMMGLQDVVFNDPQFNQQWNYHNTGQTNGSIDSDIDLPEAWAIETGKKNVIVAVIDSGVDTTHTDLRSNMWVGQNGEKFGYNFYSSIPAITPGNHGTHVAGIIGAANNNNNRGSGIAGGDGTTGSGVMLMSCQVSNANASSFSSRAIKRAFIWSADRGAAIAQNSWGTLPPNSYNIEALEGIDYFIENGGGSVLDKGLVIFSAGNSNLNAKIFPAAYERVIAVGATSHNDTRASYSSFGEWVDISAPGGDGSGTARIISTHPMNVNNGFGYSSGTSAASPHVSGVAALIVSMAEGKLSSDDVRSVLLHSSDNIYSKNQAFEGLLGKGRVNAYSALVKSQNLIEATPVAAVSNFTAEFNSCGTIRLRWDNPGGHTFMIAKSTVFKGLTGFPVGNYQVGDHIEGGGEIVYQGTGNLVDLSVEEYMDFVGFKIWHKENGNYSKGSFALISEVFPCSPPILYVKQGATGNGTSWQSASGDLQKMIELAAPGSAVYVAEGTYKPMYIGGNTMTPANADRNSFFLLSKRVRILGGFPDNNNSAGLNDRNPSVYTTILSGDYNGNDTPGLVESQSENSYHVLVTVDTRETTDVNMIDGFTITGGNANGTGGMSVRGIQIVNNAGGGWFNAGGVFHVANLIIENNRATNGGGWYNLSGSCSLKDTQIRGNTGNSGGGWYNVASNPSLYNCVIENNTVAGEGGGWYNNADSPSVFNCLITNNSAIRGGGVYVRIGSPVLLSTLVGNNIATIEGGGLYQQSGTPSLLNATIANNQSQLNGGGVFSRGIANSLNISNSIIWGNSAVNNNQIHLINSNIMTLRYSIVEGWPVDLSKFIFDTNPEFSNPSSGDFTLSSCSPAINKGNNVLLAGLNNGLDLSGQQRFFNGQVDLGAYEFQTIPEPTSLSSDEILVHMPVFNGITVLNNGCDFAARIEGITNAGGTIFSVNTQVAPTNVISDAGWNFVKRYSQIKPSGNSDGLFARITLYFKKEEFDIYNQHFGNSRGLTLPQNLKIVQFRGTSSEGFDDPFSGEQVIITPGVNDVVLDAANGIWKVSFNVYGFSTFFVTSQSAPESLPVTLLNFSGQATDAHSVSLKWESADEVNFKEFAIERSVSTLNEFKSIGKVSARLWEGMKSYDFLDEFKNPGDVLPEVAYYRLKLMDLDNTFTYSDWISVVTRATENIPQLLLYPNPVQDQAFLKFPGSHPSFSIEVFDISGNCLLKIPDGIHEEIPMQSLSSGQYLIKLTGKGWQSTKKILKK